MNKDYYEANEDIYEAHKECIKCISSINFDNVHKVGKLMYYILDRKTIEGLIHELEANIMFGNKK
jgi:UDP-N-acetylmuramyl pentapeptide synthase